MKGIGPVEVVLFERMGEPCARSLVTDAIVATVPHQAYRDMDSAAIGAMVKPDGLVADIKGIWRDRDLPNGLRRWTL